MSRKATKNLDWDEWLTVWFGPVPKDAPDLHFSGPRGCDRSLMHSALCGDRPPAIPGQPWQPSIVKELEARGYDVTTLEFRIKRKTPGGST